MHVAYNFLEMTLREGDAFLNGQILKILQLLLNEAIFIFNNHCHFNCIRSDILKMKMF